ncbi:hypothetical protein SCHPADRAFT_896718 [Schizopora paradoxa]|uniref:Uncharacterized protein n=1 Tax=Schizopora paradoxa TaxID=27342 RepID=A0A0H2QZK3_9AGAM|nr:hypothetical protein SCHPADRAFT_896718 [Schizopora paradoxa]
MRLQYKYEKARLALTLSKKPLVYSPLSRCAFALWRAFFKLLDLGAVEIAQEFAELAFAKVTCLNSRKAMEGHILALPNELLGKCFVEVVNPVALADLRLDGKACALKTVEPDYEGLKNIVAVGKHFREVAISHAVLWSYLSDAYSCGWNELLAQRSGQHELAIDLSNMTKPSVTGERRVSQARKLLDILCAEMHRVAFLRVLGVDDLAVQSSAFQTKAPVLEVFICGGLNFHSVDHSLRDVLETFLVEHCPKLGVLGVSGFNLPSFGTQTSITKRTLSSLTLWNIPFSTWPTCSELLGFLHICDHVVSLRMQSAGPRTSTDTNGPAENLLRSVNLPALEDFVIEYQENLPSLQTLKSFLSHIRPKHLKSFILLCHRKNFASTDLGTFIPRSLCPIQKIHSIRLSYPSSRSTHFVVHGTSTPGLRSNLVEEERKFSFGYGERERDFGHNLGSSTLSALRTWRVSGAKALTIFLTGSFTQEHSSPRRYLIAPNPQDILMEFSGLKTLCIVGRDNPVSAKIACQFIEALLKSGCEPAFHQLVDVKVEQVVPTRNLKSALLEFQRMVAKDSLKCWINGSLVVQPPDPSI